MGASTPRLRWLAATAIVILAACTAAERSPVPAPPTTPAPTRAPESTPSPTPSATPRAIPRIAGLEVTIDRGTSWREVFETLTEAERACIRRELAGAADALLAQPVMRDGDARESDLAIVSCLAPATARAVYLGALVAGIEEDDIQVPAEELACLRELLAAADIAALLAGGNLASAEFSRSLVRCLPLVFLAYLLADLGLDIDELSDEESACARQLMAGADVADLVDVGEGAREYHPFLTKLSACVRP